MRRQYTNAFGKINCNRGVVIEITNTVYENVLAGPMILIIKELRKGIEHIIVHGEDRDNDNQVLSGNADGLGWPD
jgi:hypothetical protein